MPAVPTSGPRGPRVSEMGNRSKYNYIYNRTSDVQQKAT